MNRAIIHLNVADFAVAVERITERRLRDRPVIIAPGGGSRALVYDMSEEAYQAGVRKGMRLSRALRRCRDASIRPPHPCRYEQAMQALIRQALPFSPLIEPGEKDGHLFIDMTGTGRLWGAPADIAWRLRKQIRKNLELDPIWSLAANKLVAKVATRVVKPIGEYVVDTGDEEKFLAPLPVWLIPGIESGELRQMREFNLTRVSQVAALSPAQLQIPFGRRAQFIFEVVRGVDFTPVQPVDQPKPGVALEHAFGEDTNDAARLDAALYRLLEQAGHALRQRRQVAGRLSVTLEFTDGIRRTRRFPVKSPTADEQALFQLSRTVFFPCQGRRLRIRRMGLVCDRLAFPPAQRPLFPEFAPARRDRARLIRAMDEIRSRFGTEAIGTGRSLEPITKQPLGPIPALSPHFKASTYVGMPAG